MNFYCCKYFCKYLLVHKSLGKHFSHAKVKGAMTEMILRLKVVIMITFGFIDRNGVFGIR